jgi:hypothetical protein
MGRESWPFSKVGNNGCDEKNALDQATIGRSRTSDWALNVFFSSFLLRKKIPFVVRPDGSASL